MTLPDDIELHTVVVTEMSKSTKMPKHEFWLTLQSKWLIDYSDVVAQEKAKWVAEVLSKCDEKEIVLMGTECKYCGDYVDYCNCHKIRQNQRDEIRQALQGENK